MTGRPQPTPPPGFVPGVGFVNVSKEGHTKVPRSSHRRGDHRPRKLLSVGVLTLYLSNKTGWKIPNAEELAAEWDEGADRIRAAIADLEAHGWLVRFRTQAERGRWITQTYVTDNPALLKPLREYADALAVEQELSRADRAAAKAAGRSEVEVFPQVAPDGGLRDPVDRDPVDRDPVRGDLKYSEEHLEAQKTPPPPVPPTLAEPSRVPEQGGGGGGGARSESPKSPSDPPPDLVAEVRRIRSAWSPTAIRHAFRGAVEEDGRPPAEVAGAILELAEDPNTSLPRRIREEAWWAAREQRQRRTDEEAPGSAATAGEHPWCGGCPKATRMVTAGSLGLAGVDPRTAVPCPDCEAAVPA